MPVRSPKAAICDASAGTRPWSSSAVGRSSRARCSSSSIAWVASALVSASSPTRCGGASDIVASSRSRIPVRAWLTSSWRSWAIRVRSCSWARSTARPDSRRSCSSRPIMRLKSPVRRWTSLEAPRETSARVPGEVRSTALMVLTSLPIGSRRRRSSSELSSTTASTARPSRSMPCVLTASLQALARDDGRHEGREGHQHGVDREHLGEQRALAHSPTSSARAGHSLMGRTTDAAFSPSQARVSALVTWRYPS